MSKPEDSETREPGSVYAWGSDEYRQLGFEESDQPFLKTEGRKFLAEPVLNGEFENLGIVQVAAGRSHSLALDEFGNVWGCGRNVEGQLGLGDRLGRSKATKVGGSLDNARCSVIACGTDCSAVITQEGNLYEWGLLHYTPEAPNRGNQSGSSSNPSVAMPGLASARPVSSRLRKLLRDSTLEYLRGNPGTRLSPLQEGEDEAAFSDSGDEIETSAGDEPGESSRTERESQEAGMKSVRTRRKPACWPVLCKELIKVKLVAVAFGYSSVMVLSEAGDVYSKGFNDKGQLGIGSRLNQVNFRKLDFSTSQRPLQDDVIQDLMEEVSEANGHSAEEKVRRLSRASTTSQFSTHMVKLACGSSHCMCLSVDGAVFVWGSNVFGQLGIGETQDALEPVLNHQLSIVAGSITDIACGSHHSSALNDDGLLFSWGHSEYGQHGSALVEGQDFRHGGFKFYHIPRAIPPFNKVGLGPRLVSISCADLFTVAVDHIGRAWSWGWDTHGALGHGRRLIRQDPQVISKLEGLEVAQVSVGHKHVLALTKPEGSRFALRYRPLFLQSDLGAPSWVLELGEHHDVGVVSQHRSWVGASPRPPVKCHRFVLFARCPPLRVLYEDQSGHSAEPEENPRTFPVIELPGHHEPLVVKALVEYLYTDQVRGCPPHRLKDLGELGSQLGLPRLTAVCLKLNRARKRQQGLDGVAEDQVKHKALLLQELAGSESNGQEPVSNATVKQRITEEVPESTFSADMALAVNNDEYADVHFVLDDAYEESGDTGTGPKKSIAVHRVILAQFPFFNKLLGSDFAEGLKMRNGELVPLTGVTYDSFYSMLHWLYTGDRSVVDETNVLEIMTGARCFGMEFLASLCESFILDRVDKDNAPELFDFAESVNAPRVLNECKKYMVGLQETEIET